MSSIGSAQPPKSVSKDLAGEDLKEKYKRMKQPRMDRIEMYCRSIKSIGLATNLQIVVEKAGDKDMGIQVSLSADPQSSKEALEKALSYVIGEFIKVDRQSKYGVIGISGPRKANHPIDVETQRSIQSEIKAKGGRYQLLTEEALKKHDLRTSCELRQFRCPTCHKPFWNTVLTHKPMASCCQCKIWLHPLKRSEEFGIGRFICTIPTCDNVFFGRCRATDTRQCKFCFSEVKNPYIHPSFVPPTGPLPYGVQKPKTTVNNEPTSEVHYCAGTCISMFVRQWDEITASDCESLRYYDPRMPTFDEADEADEAQCGSDEGSVDSDLECSPQDQAPDRRRPPGSEDTHEDSD